MVRMEVVEVYLVKDLMQMEKKREMNFRLIVIQHITNTGKMQEYYQREDLLLYEKVMDKINQDEEYLVKSIKMMVVNQEMNSR